MIGRLVWARTLIHYDYHPMAAEIKRSIPNLQNHNIGWKLLAWCGMWFIPSGTLLVYLSWHPMPGPYIIGERYPFGTLAEAWQVALGFSWVAFGLLFTGMALLGRRYQNRRIWFSLLLSLVLVLFPHVWLGVNLVLDDPALRNFGPWLIALPFSFIWLLGLALGFTLANKS